MTSHSSPLRVYLVGAGIIAGHHLRGMRAMGDGLPWEWHACDVRPEAVQKLKAEFPSLHSHADAASMLAGEPRPTDIVIICTPPSLHATFTKMALASGRNVLCEKPLFLTSGEADEVARQLAVRKDLLVACCSSRFVGRESLAKARELISGGRIGTLYRMRWIERKNRSRSGIEYQPESRWFLNRKLNGGGVAMDWAPYDFATLDAILRPERVTVVTCLMGQVETGAQLEPDTIFDVETQVVAHMKYELADGSVVQVDYERASAMHGREESTFEAEGTRGAINIDWSWGDAIRLSTDRQGAVVSEEIPLPPIGEAFNRPIQDMVRKVLNEPSLTIANEDAFFNFRCLRALYEAHESGRPVTVKRRS